MSLQIGIVIAALFVASNLWFYLRVLRPLQQLATQAEYLKNGDFAAFEQRCGGVGEIDQLQRAMAGMVGHVRRAQEQSRAYTDRLADAQEGERKRVAHDLHDDTLQSLIAISQSVELATKWLQSDPVRAAERLQSTRQQAVETISGLRSLIGGLRPPALDELGLVTALRMEAERIADPPVHVLVNGVERRLDETRELIMFRAAQEALANVRRHSHAHHVDVILAFETDGARLSVADDGTGFTPPLHLSDLAGQQHYGLIGIQERVHTFGGSVTISSSRGKGTTVVVTMPTKSTDQPAHLVTDPVCNALIEPQRAYGSLVYEGQTYYFCCPVCQGAFQKSPELYLTPSVQALN